MQPVDGGVHSNIEEVAAADGTALHARGSGRNASALNSFENEIAESELVVFINSHLISYSPSWLL